MISIDSLRVAILGLTVTVSGMSTGGLLAYCLRHTKRNLMHLVIIISTGLIGTLVLIDILPESINLGGSFATTVGIGIGYFIARNLDRFFHRVVIFTSNPQSDVFLHSALLLSIGIALHNLPVGIALGNSILNEPELAKHISIAIAIHAIPEGIAIGLPMVLSKISPLVLFVIVSITGFPTALGAFAGYQFGILDPWFLSIVLGLAIGTILYVAYFELLVPSWKDRGALQSILCLLLGMFMAVWFIISF